MMRDRGVSLTDEFFESYLADYWIGKANLMKFAETRFEEFRNEFESKMEIELPPGFERSLVLETRYTLFQSVEALYSLIFAIQDGHEADIWMYLSFMPNDRVTKGIGEIHRNKISLTRKVQVDSGEQIPLIQWLFFPRIEFKSPDIRDQNVKTVNEILLMLAELWQDRNEYNSFKHSLRMYQTKFRLSIGANNQKEMREVGGSDNASVYLEERDYQGKKIVQKTTRCFDADLDYRLLICCGLLIRNFVKIRAAWRKNEPVNYALFHDTDMKSFRESKATVDKFSLTIGSVKRKK